MYYTYTRIMYMYVYIKFVLCDTCVELMMVSAGHNYDLFTFNMCIYNINIICKYNKFMFKLKIKYSL